MWERITSTDIEQAKASLEAKRAATLSRHAEEIKDLDEQFCDIESFERVVEGFFEEYMSPDATPSGPAAVPSESSVAEARPNAPALALPVQQEVSPAGNWARVFRRVQKPELRGRAAGAAAVRAGQ
jgi:hypothetical protein